jgi:hypothetical protein
MSLVRIGLIGALLIGQIGQEARAEDEGIVQISDAAAPVPSGSEYRHTSGVSPLNFGSSGVSGNSATFAAPGQSAEVWPVSTASQDSHEETSGAGIVQVSDAACLQGGCDDFADYGGMVFLDQPSLFNDTYYTLRGDGGDGRGYQNGYASFAAFAPFYRFSLQNKAYGSPLSDSLIFGYNNLLFGNARFIVTDEGRFAGNAGLGLRGLSDDGQWIGGVSVWYDTDESNNRSRYDQIGVGLELLSDCVEYRWNFYNPTSHGSDQIGTLFGAPFYRGNRILFADRLLTESALTSADFEIGVPVPGCSRLKCFVGPYWYDSEVRSSEFGARGRIEAQVSDASTMQVAVSNDPLFGTSVTLAAAIEFGPNRNPLRACRTRSMDARMYDQVVRSDRMPIRYINRPLESPAINPATGQPYFVVHVDDTNTNAPGTGTFEDPFTLLTPAGPSPAEIILVRRGSTSRAAPLVGGTTLSSTQRLLGEGVPHTFVALGRGTFLFPVLATTGPLPFVTTGAGMDVVTLASNNETSGLNLIAPIGQSGIFGSGITNFNINNINNDITLAAGNDSGPGGGILLQNATGTGTIDNVRFASTQPASNGGIVVQNTGAGSLALNVNNVPFSQGGLVGLGVTVRNSASVALTASSVNASNNTQDGLLLDADTGGSFTAVVSNSNLSGNTRNAIRTLLAGGSTGSLNVTNTVSTFSGEHGIFISATGATLNPSIFTTVDASNSGQQGFGGLADGFHFDITNSMATVNLNSVTSGNFGGITQENGLRQIVDMGGTLVTTVTGSNFLLNQLDGMSTQVRDAGTAATLNMSGSTSSFNVRDGFLYDVTAGSFTSNVTTSSFVSNGRNGIRAIGGAAPAAVATTNVTVDSTLISSSVADGMFAQIGGAGGTTVFNFTYLPTPPSAILTSGGFGADLTFDGALTSGTVNYNGITINGGINETSLNGENVTVIP